MKIDEVVNKYLTEQTEYQKFFQKKLEKFGVKTQAELKGDQKKKFFDEVDREWKADKETD
jgi:hypothetical protein